MSRAGVTQERKLLTLATIRSYSATYVSFSAILARLRDLHEGGLWPRADWPYARNDPYDVGSRQHLEAMRREGWVEHSIAQRGWRTTSKAPATGPLPRPRPVEERAAELLPDAADVERRLAAYERTFGMPIVLGVDFDLNRVIRYGTVDGIVELPVEDGDWNRALTAVGA